MPGWVSRDALRTLTIVPAPSTSGVRIRFTETAIVDVQAGRFCQSSGRSASNVAEPTSCVSGGCSRICQEIPLNMSRSRAFQYSGSPEVTRMTSLPSRGQVIGP